MSATSRFFIKLMLFLLPLLAAEAYLEIELRNVQTSYSYKRKLLDEIRPKAQVVIFGNSHAFYDYNPESFSRIGFNFANTSQSLMIDRDLLKKYLPTFSKLKAIVLNLSYFSFEYRLYGSEDDYREYFYHPYYDIVGDGGLWSLFDLRSVSRGAVFGPTTTKKLLASNFSENLAKEINRFGWFDSSSATNDHLPISDEAGKGRAEYHTSTLKEKFQRDNLNAISDVVDLARARGIKVVLVQAPAYKTYSDHLDPRAVIRFEKNVNYLKEKVGLPFFDYLKDSRFDKSDFYDNDHLNSAGADKFSRIFDREVLTSSDINTPAN